MFCFVLNSPLLYAILPIHQNVKDQAFYENASSLILLLVDVMQLWKPGRVFAEETLQNEIKAIAIKMNMNFNEIPRNATLVVTRYVVENSNICFGYYAVYS